MELLYQEFRGSYIVHNHNIALIFFILLFNIVLLLKYIGKIYSDMNLFSISAKENKTVALY